MKIDSPKKRAGVTLGVVSLVTIGLAALLALPSRELQPDRSKRPFEVDEPPAPLVATPAR